LCPPVDVFKDYSTLQDTQQEIEGILQINQDTNKVVKEVFKTQQEVLLKQQETAEKVHQTQLEDCDTLQDSELKL